jgi:putative NADH-flavin reductase
MRIAIFGSTGKTGQHVVEQALERGYEVTAFVRDPSKLTVDPESVRVVQGDAQDAEAVAKAVEGADAVISALGQTPSSQKDLLTVSADHIVDAMKDHGVDRYVTLLGAGVSDPKDHSSIGRKFMLGLMKIFARHILEDAQNHADKVRASGLDWVIVRPPRLTDGERTGRVEAGYMKLGPSATISRADLATFMLDSVEDDTWVGQAPMVTN